MKLNVVLSFLLTCLLVPHIPRAQSPDVCDINFQTELGIFDWCKYMLYENYQNTGPGYAYLWMKPDTGVNDGFISIISNSAQDLVNYYGNILDWGPFLDEMRKIDYKLMDSHYDVITGNYTWHGVGFSAQFAYKEDNSGEIELVVTNSAFCPDMKPGAEDFVTVDAQYLCPGAKIRFIEDWEYLESHDYIPRELSQFIEEELVPESSNQFNTMNDKLGWYFIALENLFKMHASSPLYNDNGEDKYYMIYFDYSGYDEYAHCHSDEIVDYGITCDELDQPRAFLVRPHKSLVVSRYGRDYMGLENLLGVSPLPKYLYKSLEPLKKEHNYNDKYLNKVGYIRLADFSPKDDDQFFNMSYQYYQMFWHYAQKTVEGAYNALVVDIRTNGGGGAKNFGPLSYFIFHDDDPDTGPDAYVEGGWYRKENFSDWNVGIEDNVNDEEFIRQKLDINEDNAQDKLCLYKDNNKYCNIPYLGPEDPPKIHGKIAVLIDADCVSAGEQLVTLLRNHETDAVIRIFGSRTAGMSGFPTIKEYDFGTFGLTWEVRIPQKITWLFRI